MQDETLHFCRIHEIAYFHRWASSFSPFNLYSPFSLFANGRFLLFLLQQTDKRQTPFAQLTNGKRSKANRLASIFGFPWDFSPKTAAYLFVKTLMK
jgi:hypothetical protein